jgi:deoxyribonuclease V
MLQAPVLLQILQKMRDEKHPFYPQVLMVDGNGILHPRGFGLACHLGVLAHLPTIGVGKNLHHVDGLNQSEVKQSLQLQINEHEQTITLVGNSGITWGVGFRPTLSSLKPIYVSVGHRISLDSAVEVVKITCKYRVPEPIRQADIRSRAYLQKHQTESFKELAVRPPDQVTSDVFSAISNHCHIFSYWLTCLFASFFVYQTEP